MNKSFPARSAFRVSGASELRRGALLDRVFLRIFDVAYRVSRFYYLCLHRRIGEDPCGPLARSTPTDCVSRSIDDDDDDG